MVFDLYYGHYIKLNLIISDKMNYIHYGNYINNFLIIISTSDIAFKSLTYGSCSRRRSWTDFRGGRATASSLTNTSNAAGPAPVHHQPSPSPPRPIHQRAMAQLRPVSIPNIVSDTAGPDPLRRIADFDRHYMPDGQPAAETSVCGNSDEHHSQLKENAEGLSRSLSEVFAYLTWDIVPGGGQKTIGHHHKCISNYVSYMFYIIYESFLYVLYQLYTL